MTLLLTTFNKMKKRDFQKRETQIITSTTVVNADQQISSITSTDEMRPQP